jgi:hypothetical protein
LIRIKVPDPHKHFFNYSVSGKNVNSQFPEEKFYIDFSAFPARQTYDWPLIIELVIFMHNFENFFRKIRIEANEFLLIVLLGIMKGRKK